MAKIKMRQMKKNQRGTIASVRAKGEMGRRIRDMGLVPGVGLTVCERAPLYDPMSVRAGNFKLTLRNNEADHIDVEVEG